MLRNKLTGWLTALTAAATLTLGLPLAAQPAAAVAPAADGTAILNALDQAAADAQIVIVVPTMSGLSEKIAVFAAQTGLDQLAPEFDDALGAFKQQMQFLEGVDDDGALLLVVSNLAQAIQSELDDAPGGVRPATLLLIPVSDYDAFVTQLGGDPAAEVTAITFEGNQDGFAKKLNGYAVLGDTEAQTADYAAGLQGQALAKDLSQLVAQYLHTGDALVYLDIEALRPAFNAGIDRAVAEIKGQMARENQIPAEFAGLLQSVFDLYAEAGHTAVDGADKLLITLELSDAGVGITKAAQLKEGSKLAGYFNTVEKQGGPTAAAKLLAALPDRPYIVASATDANAFALEKIIAQLSDTLGQQGDTTGLAAMYLDMIAPATQVNAVASVFYAPDAAAMMSGGLMTSLTVYDVDDTGAFVAQQKAMYAKLNEMKITLPPMQEGQPPLEMSFTTTYTEKALVLDGINVDQYQVNMVLPPEMMQQFGPMAALMGNAGSGGYIAAKDGKVLLTTVTDPQLITQGLAALSADNGFGSAGHVANLRDTALPANASIEAYLSIAGIANTVNPFLLMFSPDGQQLAVPADLPPVGFGSVAADQGLATRMFIPYEVVKFGVETYLEFAPQDPDPGQAGPRSGPPRAPRY